MIRIGNINFRHLTDYPRYLATPTPKSYWFLTTFSLIMSLSLLSTWSIFLADGIKGIIQRLFHKYYFAGALFHA